MLDEGGTPLHYAALMNSSPEIINRLLNARIDVNSKTEGGITPLHCAVATRGTLRNPRILIEHGAEIDVQTRSGQSPLHQAAKDDAEYAALELLEYGATVDLTDCNGWTLNGHSISTE